MARKEKYSYNGVALRRSKLITKKGCSCINCYLYKEDCIAFRCSIRNTSKPLKPIWAHYIFIKK